MILQKVVVPALAVAGIGVLLYTIAAGEANPPPAPPLAEPARPPYAEVVAGAGLVEASTHNIAVATQLPGVVARVLVRPGERVAAGQPLFVLDERQALATVAVREAKLRVAAENLERLAALPRAEELPAARARIAETQAQVADAREQVAMVEAIADPRAVSREEVTRRRNALAAAEARLEQARAALALLEAGAWQHEQAVARAQLAAERAELHAARTELERHTVRAPVAGEVLQVNVRAGEFVSATAGSAPVVLGDTRVLHVRVDIDENDAWRVRPGAPATASLRGRSDISTPVRFVRIEPLVVPKRSLTGASTERVDTRVLQVLYAFERGELPIHAGQQMDVYIDATGVRSGAGRPADPARPAGRAAGAS